MKVWIDQDLCTGDGLCEEIAPAVFTLLDDGLAYVKEDSDVKSDPGGSAGHGGGAERPGGRGRRGLRGVPRRVHLHRAGLSRLPLVDTHTPTARACHRTAPAARRRRSAPRPWS